jgi:Hemerythrin HHE cation binding domain
VAAADTFTVVAPPRPICIGRPETRDEEGNIMSRLIEQLKGEHAAIVGVLGQVKELGIGSAEGREKLLAAKASFLAHLRKEDAELYPVLKRAAESDPRLKRTLEMFANDMEKISKATLQFFEKYAQGAGPDFAKDFGTLFGTLTARTRREENIIYQEYDRLQ